MTAVAKGILTKDQKGEEGGRETSERVGMGSKKCWTAARGKSCWRTIEAGKGSQVALRDRQESGGMGRNQADRGFSLSCAVWAEELD